MPENSISAQALPLPTELNAALERPGGRDLQSMVSTLLTTHRGRAFLLRNMRDLGVGSFSSQKFSELCPCLSLLLCCLTLMYPNLGEDAVFEMEEDSLQPDGSTAKAPIYWGGGVPP